MEKLICKECGKVFEYQKMSSCKAQMTRHLTSEHNMSVIDYVVKNEYGGVRPKCPCGCGHYLNLKDSGVRWEFNKYYADTCYGNLVRSGNEKIMKQFNETHKKESFDIVKYYENKYDRKTYQECFDLLKTREFSLSDVSKEYNIDKRTLKKVWLALKITDTVELTEILEDMKYHIAPSHKKDALNLDNDSNILAWMYKLIKENPGKYTANSLKKYYNETHRENPCAHYAYSIENKLFQIYGDEISIYLAAGIHSSEEYKFYKILCFYIPEFIVKLGKKFILPNGSVRFYDIIIGSRMLIEYDSDGFFHETEYAKDRDEKKEDFAKENGYIFLRLTKNEIKDINTVIKIRKLLNL